jgi:hypothetical protein
LVNGVPTVEGRYGARSLLAYPFDVRQLVEIFRKDSGRGAESIDQPPEIHAADSGDAGQRQTRTYAFAASGFHLGRIVLKGAAAVKAKLPHVSS